MHLHVKTLNRRNDRRKETHARIRFGQTGGVGHDNRRTVHQFSHVSRSRGGADRFTGSPGRCRRGCTLRGAPRGSFTSSVCARMIACRGRRWSVCRLGQVFNGHVITSSCVHHPAEWTTRSYNVERHEDAARPGASCASVSSSFFFFRVLFFFPSWRRLFNVRSTRISAMAKLGYPARKRPPDYSR